MALYAVNEDDLIYAGDAELGKIYWCLDCFGPVKRRRGKSFLPHFYHLKAAPQCRLYSKTDDHLLAQIQLQKLFPTGALQIERPFIQINRVADLCWEDAKIIFEIQCSPITEKEVEMRMNDYRSVGFEVVWLLDDKRYNKRMIRPAEGYLRKRCAYYMAIKQGLFSEYYDQFEIFVAGCRVKKGRRMPVDLRQIRRMPNIIFDEALMPKQIMQLFCAQYFYGDRMYRALQNHLPAMQYWRSLEVQFAKQVRAPSLFARWFHRYIAVPYLSFLARLLVRR